MMHCHIPAGQPAVRIRTAARQYGTVSQFIRRQCLIERDGCDIEYLTHGRKAQADGTPNEVITFIHGAGGNGFTWCFNIPSFTSTAALGRVTPESGQRVYFVIAFVMRGFGGSRVHSGSPLEGWTAENVVGDLLAVLDKEEAPSP